MIAQQIRRTFLLVAMALALAGSVASAQGGPPSWSIDILSNDRYPLLKDSWMMRINNQGVAAGYIATDTTFGPYLPTTYAGGGQFQTVSGLQSPTYSDIVTGINARGDVVGNLYDANFDTIPYIARGGAGQPLAVPAGAVDPYASGINAAGLAYGYFFDPSDQLAKVFTTSGSTATVLPLAAAGFTNFLTDPFSLSASGLLGVYGLDDNFATQATFLYNLTTSSLKPLVAPNGFDVISVGRVTDGFVFGIASTADFSRSEYGFWNADGTFRAAFDVPAGIRSVHVNDLGQAVGIVGGQLMFFDGTSWSQRTVAGLGSYTLAEIDDFNDRGDFVGLADNGHGFEWGFRAEAVPEPASLALMGSGALALGLCLRRRRA